MVCSWEGKGNCRELNGKRGLKKIKERSGEVKENTREKDKYLCCFKGQRVTII